MVRICNTMSEWVAVLLWYLITIYLIRCSNAEKSIDKVQINRDVWRGTWQAEWLISVLYDTRTLQLYVLGVWGSDDHIACIGKLQDFGVALRLVKYLCTLQLVSPFSRKEKRLLSLANLTSLFAQQNDLFGKHSSLWPKGIRLSFNMHLKHKLHFKWPKRHMTTI